MYLLGIIIFYLLPGVCIALIKKNNILPAILFSLIAVTPLALVVDYIGTVSNIWHVPNSLFPLFLGVLPIEDYIWMLSGTFTIIMIAGLFDSRFSRRFAKKPIWALSIISLALICAFFVIYARFGKSFFIFETPLLYIMLGFIFFLSPTVLLLICFRKRLVPYWQTTAVFFILTLIFEIFATLNNWWEFTGTYFLPHLTIMGKILPTEEIFFVGVVGPLMATMLYKLISKRRFV